MSRTWKQLLSYQRALYTSGECALALIALLCAPAITGATEAVIPGPMCGGTYYTSLAQVIGPGQIDVTSFYKGPPSVCESVTSLQFSDTQDPQTGQYVTPNPDFILNKLHQINFPNPIQQPGPMNQHYNPGTTTDGNGVRGSLDGGGGFTLSTASPGYDAFVATGLNTTTYVPFGVLSAGENGWMSIYGPSGVLFSDPLSLFTPDTIYFAVIPPQTSDSDVEALLTYWVGTPSSGSSSVYFPAEVTAVPTTVPEPDSLALLLTGVGGLILFRVFGQGLRSRRAA